MLDLSNINPEFEKAVNNKMYRQSFIDSINLGSIAPYVARVMYDPHCKKYRKKSLETGKPRFLMAAFTGCCYCHSLGKRSIIYVSRNAFEPSRISNGIEFYTTLIDHEGLHAKDMFDGIKVDGVPTVTMINERFASALLESRAYENEINSIMENRRAVSGMFLLEVLGFYKLQTDSLFRYAKSGIEKRIADARLRVLNESFLFQLNEFSESNI